MEHTSEAVTDFFIDINTKQILIGQVALAAHIEAGADPMDVAKLGWFLKSALQIAEEDKNFMTVDALNEDDYRSMGRWLHRIAFPLDQHVLVRAGQLGLIPSITNIRRTFTSASHFYQAMELSGVRRRNLFRHQTQEDYVRYVAGVFETRKHNSLFNELKERAYRGENLSPEEIREVIGMTLSEILEMAGFVYNIRWPREKYEMWGVKFMHANEGNIPTASAIDYLSRRKRGPSRFGIRKYFGNIPNFQGAVREEFRSDIALRESRRKSRLDTIDKSLQSLQLHPVLFNDAVGDSDPIITFAKLQIIDVLLPELPLRRKYVIAASKNAKIFVDTLLAADSRLSASDIEDIARKLEVYQDIWPMDDYMEYLKIDS